jgi:hypothetical protein
MPTPPVTPRDDAAQYPTDLIASRLGEKAVAELQKAKPKRWFDAGMLRDQLVINAGALSFWLHYHFQLNIFNDADAARVVDVDPLAERIVIRRSRLTDYCIPHWCYLRTMDLPGDDRPDRWPGVPAPTASTQS